MILLGLITISALTALANGVAKIEIAVDSVHFAVVENGDSEPTYEEIKAGKVLNIPAKIDTSKRIAIKFSVLDKKQNAAIAVHQAFVGFVHVESRREVIFLATLDKTTKAYTFNLDLKTQHKKFGGLSGRYTLAVIAGDAMAMRGLHQPFVDATITVPKTVAPPVPKSKRINYEPLPEIAHKFAEPGARPHQIVSDAFAALCLLPLAALLVAWIRIGFNLKNLSISIWALGFHVGLAAIFVLYFFYWIQLNMFQTLNYLSGIGLFTFVCGNRFLHNFHKTKKEKAE